MTTPAIRTTTKDYTTYEGTEDFNEFTRIHDLELAKLTTKRTHAAGDLRKRIEAYWDFYMSSKIVNAYVTGDGFIRVDWKDATEDGSFHLPLHILFAKLDLDDCLARFLRAEAIAGHRSENHVCEASKLPMIRDLLRQAIAIYTNRPFANPLFPITKDDK